MFHQSRILRAGREQEMSGHLEFENCFLHSDERVLRQFSAVHNSTVRPAATGTRMLARDASAVLCPMSSDDLRDTTYRKLRCNREASMWVHNLTLTDGNSNVE